LQGRIGAIDDTKFGDREVLIDERVVMSTKLKTGIQYGFQPVTVSNTTAQMLELYLNYVRPNMLTESDDPLFIGQSGGKLRMGRLLTAYFKRKLSLQINSTCIRSIVETEAEGLLLTGEISSADRASVLNLNGHTGATSAKYYQKRSLVQDVAAGISVHQKLMRTERDENSSEPSIQTMFDSADEDNTDNISPGPSIQMMFDSADEDSTPGQSSLNFTSDVISGVGTLHPFFNEAHARRVKWTDTEVNMVGTWIVNYLRLYPDCSCVISKCLSYILSDKTVYPNFHPNHVMDSTRLRYGWERYKEENNLSGQY